MKKLFKPIKVKPPKTDKKHMKVLLSGKEVAYKFNNDTGIITLKKPIL